MNQQTTRKKQVKNELLRSAYAIASRRGESTNWDAFIRALTKQLCKDAGVPETADEQAILRATCTPLTFRQI